VSPNKKASLSRRNFFVGSLERVFETLGRLKNALLSPRHQLRWRDSHRWGGD
jgi:hypothetical protein